MSIHTSFELLTFARTGLLSTLDGLTLEQINRVPKGFNNNLAWQLGHVISAAQGLGYAKGGLPVKLDPAIFAGYASGTKPEKDISQSELDALKKLALGDIEQLKQDVAANVFANYMPYTVRDLKINNIEDSLQFVVFHEGMHLGAARDLRRAVAA